MYLWWKTLKAMKEILQTGFVDCVHSKGCHIRYLKLDRCIECSIPSGILNAIVTEKYS